MHVIVGVWNARSAVNKALEVNDMIVERDLDVLCLTAVSYTHLTLPTSVAV